MKKNIRLLFATTAVSLTLAQASYAAVIIGADDFDTTGTYLTRTFSSTVNSGTATFDVVDRSTLLNPDIVDNSAFASGQLALDAGDSVGFLESTDTDAFLGINRASTSTLTYTFDIDGYTDLSLSADWIFGENWVSTVEVTASIDGGSASTLFAVVRDFADYSLTMEAGDSYTQANSAEILVNGVETALLTDTWTNYAGNIAGTGEVLTIIVSQPGSFAGSLGIDNFVLTGTAIPEPSSYTLLAGLSGLVFVMLRRRRD